ncbi:hypothetical protein NDU88_011052 [Pleurodeles waltl]|uniref:Transcription factor HES-5 n=1 Tax=Pleurodeles waltl TaxID=8319 RepID=A0AAV7R2A3_PLEWA|nr:hypothetical protein NDU88_011052 [Pleurodeles waltl]
MAPNIVCLEPTKLTPREKNKIRKPAVEKMRRDRINNSIEQLKRLLETQFEAQSANAKLEKADILEMAVSYLKEQRQAQTVVVPFHKHTSSDFQEGYSRCFQEAYRFLLAHNVQAGIYAKLFHNTQPKEMAPTSKEQHPIVKPICPHVAISTPWRPW